MELVWDEVYENERRIIGQGWQKCPQLMIDPPNFTDYHYRAMPDPTTISLPNSDADDAKHGWVWADEWQVSDKWYYAISFGATLDLGFEWFETDNPNIFLGARQRIWKRARIRRIDTLISNRRSQVTEYVIENLRRKPFSNKWVAPYLPGDRPHYSNAIGKLKTKQEIESLLPPFWKWKNDWKIQTGPHCDSNGWEYSIGLYVFLTMFLFCFISNIFGYVLLRCTALFWV